LLNKAGTKSHHHVPSIVSPPAPDSKLSPRFAFGKISQVQTLQAAIQAVTKEHGRQSPVTHINSESASVYNRGAGGISPGKEKAGKSNRNISGVRIS